MTVLSLRKSVDLLDAINLVNVSLVYLFFRWAVLTLNFPARNQSSLVEIDVLFQHFVHVNYSMSQPNEKDVFDQNMLEKSQSKISSYHYLLPFYVESLNWVHDAFFYFPCQILVQTFNYPLATVEL